MVYFIDDPQSFYNFVDLIATDILNFRVTSHYRLLYNSQVQCRQTNIITTDFNPG